MMEELGMGISEMLNEKYDSSADNRIRTLCQKEFHNRIPKEMESKAKERLRLELEMICRNHYSNFYLWLYDIINGCQLKPSQYSLRGCGAGSIVCYLLTLSKTNPLDGRMPLYHEFFMGRDGTKEPDLELNIDIEVLKEVQRVINKTVKGRARINLVDQLICTLNTRLTSATGYYPSEAEIGLNEIIQLFLSEKPLNMSEPFDVPVSSGLLGIPGFDSFGILQLNNRLKPKSFSDMVKVLCLYYGTDVWYANGEFLFVDGKVSLETIIACREDLYETLMFYGFSKERALYLTLMLQKGQWARGMIDFDVEKEMIEHGLPEWLIWSLKRIKYLFSRAHMAEYLQMALRALYYKWRYPEEYYPRYFELYGNAFIRDYYYGDHDDYFRLAQVIDEDSAESLYQYLVWQESIKRWVA